MIKRILEMVPKWTIACLLFFTQIHAQTEVLFTFTKKELGHLSVCSVISVVDKKIRNVFINHRDHREGILVTEKVNTALESIKRAIATLQVMGRHIIR